MAYTILRTLRARQDLEEIGHYTLGRWGRRQMAKYLRQLEMTIQTLAEDPEALGQHRGHIKPGLRSLRHEQYHFVFYRVQDRRVEILRVLHQRRDWATLLKP
ncbi:MAG: type II toxin-antitoxin system RelE/ParE family toxin [Deltaproteobacteria bacterium]|nr:type II toxin-antitoxin system RelE/ParE family toxin [Deltaproteobacteria bacterium]